MSLLKSISVETSSPEQKRVLEGLKAKLGKVPNIYAGLAHSPSTLEAMLNYSTALRKGVLSAKEIEAVALAVGERNSCEYCLSAHTAIGKSAGMTTDETLQARAGKASDPKLKALVELAGEIVATQGRPSSRTVENFHKAGYTTAALVELIAWVTYNIFTNYFNHINETEVDFPKAQKLGK